MRKTESTRPFAVLPALLALSVGQFIGFTDAVGQDRYRVIQAENVRQGPGAQETRLGRVEADVVLPVVATNGQWMQVEITGWIWSRSVGRINTGEYTHRVTAQGGENLRIGPNGQVIGRFSTGALFNELDRDGNWINVRRVAWMFSQSLELVARDLRPTPSSSTPPPTDTPDASVGLDVAKIGGSVTILDTPEGADRAVSSVDAPVTVVGRSGDWVRVRLEGWVRASDVSPANDEVLTGVTGAEVRGNPAIYVGKMVRWRLQFISLQVANELRRDIPEGATYMLARGPSPEPGFVYALLSAAQAEELQGLQPLADLDVIGRVRSGRAGELGNPIIDVIDLASPAER